jgi:hypothetical protein
MKPTYPINYRGGWMQPAIEYVPEVRKSRPTWKPNNKLPDYGPVIDDPPQPRHFISNHPKSYQKIQYREPFHDATPVTEFINEPHVLDPIESKANNMKTPAQSSLREPLRFHDTYDNQDITEREWHQRKLTGITNISNLGNFVDQLWNDVQKATSTLNQSSDDDIISLLQSKLESLPDESIRVNVEELNELRDLGVTIPQRVNRSDTVKKAIQRQIDKLESTLKKNI